MRGVKVFEDDTAVIYNENGKLKVEIKRDKEGYLKRLSKEAREFIKNWKG